jgi:hypothetical protein
MHVDATTETAAYTLSQYNTQLAGGIGGNILANVSPNQYAASQNLFKILITHTDFVIQVMQLNKYLSIMGLHELKIKAGQQITLEEINVYYHGSGLRSVLSILAALTDPSIKILLIDELEISLEPRLQKVLRELLYDFSKSAKVVTSTHSHLFLNRLDYSLNNVVARSQVGVAIRELQSRSELYDIAFNLLGSSLEDLFFPNNFLIVEGSSDQVIAERVMGLMKINPDRVKIVSATGVGNIRNVFSVLSNTLLPLVLADSPYAKRMVALIDRPTAGDEGKVSGIRRVLKDRLVELPDLSMEQYLPAELYERAGRDKARDLYEIERVKGDYIQVGKLKKSISDSIAKELNEGDLEGLAEIVSAIKKSDQ